MTEHVVRQARIVAAREPSLVTVALANGSTVAGRRWLGVPCTLQRGDDLGARLEHAFGEGARRAHVTTVVGGDCPTVIASDLLDARAHAGRTGAAIIPARDGGFCALALRRDVAEGAPGLFGSIAWGANTVCSQTVERLRTRCPEIVVMPARQDIDVPDDLAVWDGILRDWYRPPDTLGVVLPVLNDAGLLAELLPKLGEPGVTVVVADGGSTDSSVAVARAAGVKVVQGARGRGAQMNAAADMLDTDALLFLHADTHPPAQFARLVLEALADPSVSVGAFEFATDLASPMMRLIEFGTRLRGSMLGMPYGDQGLFCRTVLFEALGGFPEVPVMEDYEFVRAAGKAGRVRVLPERATTSARRWREQGPLRWTALNAATVVGYKLGASHEELAAWRRAHSKR